MSHSRVRQLLVGAANTYPVWFHDPWPLPNGLGREGRKRCYEQRDHAVPIRFARSEDDNARPGLRRILADVGEVQVEREEDAAFPLARFDHASVGCADQVLFVDGGLVPAGPDEKPDRIDRRVLVDLGAHPPTHAGSRRMRSCARSAA